MYVKPLSEEEKRARKQRFEKIKELQEKGICFGCYNFQSGDFVREEGIIMDYCDTVEQYRCKMKEWVQY